MATIQAITLPVPQPAPKTISYTARQFELMAQFAAAIDPTRKSFPPEFFNLQPDGKGYVWTAR